MKRTWIIGATVSVVLTCSLGASAGPWMTPPMIGDDWGPFLLYKNIAEARIGNSAWDAQGQAHDWELGLRTTASGYTPVVQNKNIVWPNDVNVPFSLTFTKDTGAVQFTVEGLTGPGTISYDYEEYAGRGFDDLHIMAASLFDLVETFTCSINGLQLNGNSYDFMDLTASGIHSYATIKGIGFDDFTLTGYIKFSWSPTGNPYGDGIQALFAFGEPNPGGPPDDPDKFTKLLLSDLNGDGIVDFRDFAILGSYWSGICTEPNLCGGSDFDESHLIDGNDLFAMAEEWLEIKYGGGGGTEDDPYLIYTAAELNAIGIGDDLNAHFRLMANIDLSGYTGSSFNTIGNWELPFTGVFDGNDFAISNFSQGGDDQYPIGFFGSVVDPNAIIKHLRLINPNIVTKNCAAVGTLCGWLREGLISRCSVEGGSVTGLAVDNIVGGLVGGIYHGTVSESASNADVSAYNVTGGLVGSNRGLVESCLTDGNDVKGHDNVGALVGYNNYEGIIANSYAQRAVFAHDGVGGLAGWNSGTIENCYATGSISENSDYAGGLVGRSTGTINASFWDIETGGPDNGFGIPKTTAEMKTKGTFTSADWDFTTPIWAIDDANDHPRLWWEVAPQPDPMTWASPPVTTGAHSIIMTATTAASQNGSDVEYYFNNVTDPNHDSGWQDSTTYLNTELKEETEYTYRVKARDKSSMANETHYSVPASATTTTDTTPPDPDPAQWDIPPDATSSSSIRMEAVAAVDGAGVEYYFTNITDSNNHDSGWQDSPIYEDTGLNELTEYTYQVKARDKSNNQNETDFSSPASATTQDGTPPTPDRMTWETVPAQTGPYSIIMTATTASDISGVEYYFNNINDPNHDSGWQDGTTYEDTDLDAQTEYFYQVKARDKSVNNNQTAYSIQASATTPVDNTIPQPDPMTWASVPEATGPHSITMTATTATDEGSVQYYFNNITDPNHDSGWQSSPTYEDLGLESLAEYSYRVKARDKSGNETAYSSPPQSATTMDPIPLVEEQEAFYSIAPQDGRTWNLNGGAVGIDFVHDDFDDEALRLGDYAGKEGYKVILSFDTSFLPEDSTIISVSLQLIRGHTPPTAQDPFTWAGNCAIDVANPYFGSGPELHESDWQAAANAVAVANFLADPGPEQQMVSTEFNAQGRSFINTQGLTQLRVYFATSTNFDSSADFIGFYSGEQRNLYKRPKLTIRYITRTPTVRFPSIATEDGRVWDVAGAGEGWGYDSDDTNDIALRLGDYSGTQGYRNILSFDTSTLPPTCLILVARLELTRGANAGVSPFEWAGDCLVDVADPPYFGTRRTLETVDWQAPTSAVGVASFLEDPGEAQQMTSTLFNAAGLNNISVSDRTQVRVYFTTGTNGDNSTDIIGFYAGEAEQINRPKLAVRYTFAE